ncbi:MAG: class I SAM-dependent methyltransferase [Hyphomonas sp.]
MALTDTLTRNRAFIAANTRLAPVDGLTLTHRGEPEPLRIWQADEITPIWSATEEDLDRQGIEPPFWAFPWAGGQAVARLILERPEIVRGKRVLDIACGSGMVGIAAAAAGASAVWVNDIDPICEAAAALNAEANGVSLSWRGSNLLEAPPADVEVILAGDIFYEMTMAARFLDWLRQAAAGGIAVYAGDPGRAYAPAEETGLLAEYDIATTLELESATARHARVWQIGL